MNQSKNPKKRTVKKRAVKKAGSHSRQAKRLSSKKKVKTVPAYPNDTKPELTVSKFGGSSLATASRIKTVADIVCSDENRRFIVVSAPGKEHNGDTKITDLLIQCAGNKASGKKAGRPLDTITKRFKTICRQLDLADATFHKLIKGLEKAVDTPVKNRKAYDDLIKSRGEDMMARIFAAYLSEKRKVAAHYLSPENIDLVVTEEFGDAYPLSDTPEKLKKNLKDRPGITVLPGFYGITTSGKIATFSRGGSDLTGALIAEAVNADVYENWTDVDGIFRADPRIIANPEVIPEITFREIRELSYMGFDVLHHEAILPVRRQHIPINLRNTNKTHFPGTMILEERIPLDDVLVGIAAKKQFCCFTVQKYLMNREIGFGRKLLSILEDFSLTFEHMPSGIDTISVYLDQNQLQKDMTGKIIRRLYRDLEAERVEAEHDRAMVIAVGEGMKAHVGVAARIVNALSRNKINIHMINQGASEISILFGVREEDTEAAVTAIHDEYFGK